MSRPGVKSAVFSALDWGPNHIARWIHRRSLVALCYHGVVSTDQSHDRFGYINTVSASEFDQHLAYLKRHFNPVSATQVIEAWEGRSPLPPNPVLITFDDGYRNNWTVAAPILLKYKLPAVFHVSTAYIGSTRILWPDDITLRVIHFPGSKMPLPNSESAALPADTGARRAFAANLREQLKRLPNSAREAYLNCVEAVAPLPPSLDHELLDFLSWDELRQLSHAGFEIGSHTVTHPILSRCTPDHVRAELRDSKAAIEQATGRPCYVLAYPNGMPGDYTAETEAIAAETGFRLAFAVHDCLAPASASRFAITRVSVPGHFPRSVFAARASGTWHLLRGSA